MQPNDGAALADGTIPTRRKRDSDASAGRKNGKSKRPQARSPLAVRFARRMPKTGRTNRELI
jgi:hypothetical protein